MSRQASPFRPAVVLAMLAVGFGAFLLLLYAIGQGWDGGEEENGGSHAASNSLNGYAALVSLLEATGHEVELTRNPADMADDYAMLVLTPPSFSDPEELNELIQRRIDSDPGPTIIVLPKWQAYPVPEGTDAEVEDGWVLLGGAQSPAWFGELEIGRGAELAIGQTGGWQGFGNEGDLPDEERVQALVGGPDRKLNPLITDAEGDVLAAEVVPGYFEGSDVYYEYDGYEPWPIIVVFEPDLLNNYGMADEDRAALAMALFDHATYGDEIAINFDLTLAGLGASQNLLTLAFEPPFLAATLCLLLAALVIAWRAFHRFGPAMASAPTVAQGKRQLALNTARLVERVKRWHLLKQPYEDLVGRRVARALGLPAADHEHREIAIDAALARRGHDGPPFSHLAGDLREARRPREIIRAARALRKFERTLTT